MKPLQALILAAHGPDVVEVLVEAGASVEDLDAANTRGSVSLEWLQRQWAGDLPPVGRAVALINLERTGEGAAYALQVDHRETVRRSAASHPSIPLSYLEMLSVGQNRRTAKVGQEALVRRLHGMRFEEALEYALDSGEGVTVEAVAVHPLATDEGLVSLMLAFPVVYVLGAKNRTAALLARRSDLDSRSVELIEALLRDSVAGRVVAAKLDSTNAAPRAVLRHLRGKEHQPSGLLSSLCAFEASDPGYFEDLCGHLRNFGVEPSSTHLVFNTRCPWTLLADAALSERTYPLAGRAVCDTFGGNPQAALLAASLMDGFSGSVWELVACVEALCREVVPMLATSINAG